MIPVIDFQSPQALTQIETAYTTLGFAVFENALTQQSQLDITEWHQEMQKFFELDLDTKLAYPYDADTNLGYSRVGDENVDPTAPKDIKESFNYNNTRMAEHLWPDLTGFKQRALRSIEVADDLTLSILDKFDTILDAEHTLVRAHQQPYNTTSVIH